MKFCVYAREPGLWGWLKGWYLVYVTEYHDQATKLAGGYCAEALNMGCTLKVMAMKPPLPFSFYFFPRNAEEIRQVS